MKRTAIVVVACLVAAAAAGAVVIQTFKSPPKLFKRNAELKAQGYYMAEFEFKMEAVLFHLNNGSYWQTYRTLHRIRREMETLEGLVKVPQNASTDELIAFLLERQNADTGAFMAPGYPLFTFIGPTANVLDQLDSLSVKTGRPVRLKYPLRFLDEIRTPQQLRAYLDSFLYVKELWAERFGGPTPYVVISELSPDTLSLFERVGNYRFSDEWRETLTQWFYETQDPATGFWGARIGNRDHWRQAIDIDSTSHILPHFVGRRGEVLNPKYPLRYVEPLARILLEEAAVPVPDGPIAQHAWNLRQNHAAKIIVRWLWPALSEQQRQLTLRVMPDWLERRFGMYRPAEGGFAVDSSSPRADIDATNTALSFLQYVGYIPGTWERERLRPKVLATEPEVLRFVLTRWEDAVVPPSAEFNSIRVYKDRLPADEPWDDSALAWIVYPRETRIPDIMELRHGLARYMTAAGGEFGNWTSKASLQDRPLALGQPARAVRTTQGALDMARIAGDNPDAGRFFVVGLDRFQVPLFRHEYCLAGRYGPNSQAGPRPRPTSDTVR